MALWIPGPGSATAHCLSRRLADLAHGSARGGPGPDDVRLLVITPMCVEQLAVRRALPAAWVVCSGMGAARARSAALRMAAAPADAIAIAGFCGALVPGMRPGDVVVASELRTEAGVVGCTSGLLAEALAAIPGQRVHVGPVASVESVVFGARRARLAAGGALAVDTESAWLAAGAGERPLAVLRVVLDTPEREIYRPLATLAGSVTAWRALRRVAPALALWARAQARS